MKYGKWVKRIGAAAFALTVVSSCIVGGTLAKYTTTVGGAGSAIVARWAPSFQAGVTGGTLSDTIKVNLADTNVMKGKIAADRIAPGTNGSFDIVVSGGATEVEFNYSVTISNLKNCPKNLTFYKADGTTPLTQVDLGAGVMGYKLSSDTPMTVGGSAETMTVIWKWPYEEGVDDPAKAQYNADDVAIGTLSNVDDRTMSFQINCEATQTQPAS